MLSFSISSEDCDLLENGGEIQLTLHGDPASVRFGRERHQTVVLLTTNGGEPEVRHIHECVEGDDDRVTFYCCDGFEHETQNTDDVLGDVDLDDILADVDLDEDDVDEDDVDEDDVDEEDARHISIIPTGKPAQQ